MSLLPSLQLKKFIGSTKDPRGSVIKEYAPLAAIDGFVVPRSTSEPTAPGYENRTIDELSLMGYSVLIDPRDIVVVNGVSYEVEGNEFNFSEWNPFSDFGGKQVALKKV